MCTLFTCRPWLECIASQFHTTQSFKLFIKTVEYTRIQTAGILIGPYKMWEYFEYFIRLDIAKETTIVQIIYLYIIIYFIYIYDKVGNFDGRNKVKMYQVVYSIPIIKKAFIQGGKHIVLYKHGLANMCIILHLLSCISKKN